MGEEVGVIAELSRVDRRWRWSGRANTDCGSEMASANRKAQTATSARLLLMSQPRPERSVHRSEGWTPETVASHAMPALKSGFYALDRSADVFTWDPV